MAKKHKKQTAVSNEAVIVTAEANVVTQDGTSKASNRFRKVNFKQFFEAIKCKFFADEIYMPIIDSDVKVNFAQGLRNFVSFLLSKITFDTAKVYVSSRQHFLHIVCNLLEVTPSLSKRSNAKENKSKAMYGDVKKFELTFDVDKFYSKFISSDCFVCNGINVLISKYDVLYMAHETFESFKAGNLLNDTDCEIIELDASECESFLITLKAEAEKHELEYSSVAK